MHALGEKNKSGKEKTFSYKRPGDHWRYEEKLYFRTTKRKSIYNVPEVTCNKALKSIWTIGSAIVASVRVFWPLIRPLSEAIPPGQVHLLISKGGFISSFSWSKLYHFSPHLTNDCWHDSPWKKDGCKLLREVRSTGGFVLNGKMENFNSSGFFQAG